METQLIIDNVDRIPENNRKVIEKIIRDVGIDPKYCMKTDYEN